MTNRTCSIDGCERKHYCRGWCKRHYNRWQTYGDPLGTSGFRGPVEQRLWNHVSITPSCWLWTGATTATGYGKIWRSPPETGQVYVHRLSYEIHIGPIPDGLEIDHLCRVRSCVNPAHLEAVTREENIRRSDGVTAKNARKTHCIRGHEFTPENTYTPPAKPTIRQCNECRRITHRKAWKQSRGSW